MRYLTVFFFDNMSLKSVCILYLFYTHIPIWIFFFFFFGRTAWLVRILVPQPGIEPWAMAVKELSPNC